jgi:pSer/pThr/pTyr-binding forkhead associated (FHA) protein
VEDTDIVLAGIAVTGILFLYLIYRVMSRKKKKKPGLEVSPSGSPSEQDTRANLTRVLPVGMLIAKTGSKRGMVFAIDPSGIKIGRDKEKNQIIIEDPVISREHVWVGLSDGKVMIKDMNSSNGTYINSLDIPRITSQELNDGDIIYIGKNGIESFKFKAA